MSGHDARKRDGGEVEVVMTHEKFQVETSAPKAEGSNKAFEMIFS